MADKRYRARAFTTEEMIHISKNFKTLLYKGNLQMADLCEDPVDSISLGTLRTLYQYEISPTGTMSTLKTIERVARFFSRYFGCCISVDDLIRKDFSQIDLTFDNNEREKYDWYEGIYYAFSLSFKRIDKEDCLQYSLIRIYTEDNSLKCRMIISSRAYLHIGFERYIGMGMSFEEAVQRVSEELSENHKKSPFLYYHGDVLFLNDSVTLNLIGQCALHTRCITFKDYRSVSKFRQFNAIIGTMLTGVKTDYVSVAQLVCLCRNRKTDISGIKHLLSESLTCFKGGFVYDDAYNDEFLKLN